MTTVVTLNDASQEEQAHGQILTVKEGHLLVQRRNGQSYDVVAVYAPGRWASAEVKQEQ